MRIGPISLRNPVVLAPMAGTTDRPFRELVWELGAGLVVAEMTSARPDLWDTATSQRRRLRSNASGPFVLQIASTRAFCARACRSAIKVSIVSPDWEMAMTKVDRSSTGSR